jgi:hypothetical protein
MFLPLLPIDEIHSEAKYDLRPKNISDTLNKPANGLLSAQVLGSEGVASSDGEGSGPSGTPKSVCFPIFPSSVTLSGSHRRRRAKKRRKESSQILIHSFLLPM